MGETMTTDTGMVNGTVKFYNVKKMFGFITGDDGNDYFVHISGLRRGVRLKEGDRVTFQVAEGNNGPKAIHVEKLDGFEGEEALQQPSEVVPADETE